MVNAVDANSNEAADANFAEFTFWGAHSEILNGKKAVLAANSKKKIGGKHLL